MTVPKMPADQLIRVRDELRNPHKLVSESAHLLRGADPQEGLVRYRNARCLDISVAPASLDRALRIMDALIRALEGRGLKGEVTPPLTDDENRRRGEDDPPDNVTRVRVTGEWIQFGITEKRTVGMTPAREPPARLRGQELQSWLYWNQPRKTLVPTGVLELFIDNSSYALSRHRWRDGKRRQLEEQLDDFVAELDVAAAALKKQREERVRQQLEYREQEQRRHEQEQRRREEGKRAAQLEDEVRRWRLAGDIRAYVAAVREEMATSTGVTSEPSKIEERLSWAEEYATRIDPVLKLRRRQSGDELGVLEE
ncbi:MAG: hypothetical protein HYR74_06790 [Candidatus Eisenbacteria bacterium]|nr:hypothetical protein [Candidatus Eisenbacteria bacterium]